MKILDWIHDRATLGPAVSGGRVLPYDMGRNGALILNARRLVESAEFQKQMAAATNQTEGGRKDEF